MKYAVAGALWALASFYPSFAADETDQQKLIARGKTLYMSNCIACHNRDPNKKGSLGPELVGTPLEVMQLKVPTGTQYPPGYKPKRTTKIMQKLPKLAKDVPAIHAWIQSVARQN